MITIIMIYNKKYTQLLEIVVAFGCERFSAAYYDLTFLYDNNSQWI